MSDMFVPELMELDCYWQKAVEDAICDTLKGEKRLYYALRNRKKINQKLEKLGLRAVRSKLISSLRSPGRSGMIREFPDLSQSGSDSSLENDPEKSKSKMLSRQETPPEKRPKSPDRTLLWSGSIEKMKKSQNSFNCEPMGMTATNDFVSDEEVFEEGNKRVHWLHKRSDNQFEKTNLGSVSQSRSDVRDEGYKSDKDKSFSRLSEEEEINESSSLTEVKENSDLDKKLILALAKRDILNEQLKATSIGSSSNEIALVGSAVKIAEKKKKGLKLLSPFARFYLEVYRELCHKCSARQIAEEAVSRWRGMTKAQKAAFSASRSRK